VEEQGVLAPDDEPCLTVPAWLGIERLSRLRRERPWLPRLAAATLAVRVLAARHPELATAAGLASVRVSGLGDALVYDGPRRPLDPRMPFALAVGPAHYLFDPVERRIAACTPDLVAVHEALAASDDVDAAAEWLAAWRSLSADEARTAVRVAAEKLQAARMPARAA
jgi:hypothetical protein